MYPHRIRLRGPWECEPLARMASSADAPTHLLEASVPPKLQVSIPCTWNDAGLGDFSGRVRFRRRFNSPGRIDGHERVWLTFESAERTAELSLNGHFLGRHEGALEHFEFDVTPLLERRNEL